MIPALLALHLDDALHEVCCATCRVSWPSWLLRLVGIRR